MTEHGPLTIPELLRSTRVQLTPLLHALQNLQQFHLIAFASDDHRVRPTPVGVQAATTGQASDMRAAATRALED